MSASRSHPCGAQDPRARAASEAEEPAASADVLRFGKWTLRYIPPVAQARPWVFTHDEFNGAPDMLDPRHGCCTSIGDCLSRIAEIETCEPAEDGGAFDVTTLSPEELLAISDQLVSEGLLVRTSRGTGYALTPAGRARQRRSSTGAPVQLDAAPSGRTAKPTKTGSSGISSKPPTPEREGR